VLVLRTSIPVPDGSVALGECVWSIRERQIYAMPLCAGAPCVGVRGDECWLCVLNASVLYVAVPSAGAFGEDGIVTKGSWPKAGSERTESCMTGRGATRPAEMGEVRAGETVADF
jgi:hypothetical protein